MDMNAIGESLVDVDDALKRIGGNKDLYKRLLGRFVTGNHLDALDNAIQGGNPEEMERMAHTLKGVCANLSLVKLAGVSADLEQLVKAGGDYSACFADLKLTYDATLAKIAEIVG